MLIIMTLSLKGFYATLSIRNSKHNGTQHDNTICINCHYAESYSAECRVSLTVTLSVIMPSVLMPSVLMPSVFMLSVFMLSVIMLSVFMLSVFVLSVFMLSVFMLSVFMLSVVASHFFLNSIFSFGIAKLWNKLTCSSVYELRTEIQPLNLYGQVKKWSF
jgi:hypothetical protein